MFLEEHDGKRRRTGVPLTEASPFDGGKWLQPLRPALFRSHIYLGTKSDFTETVGSG